MRLYWVRRWAFSVPGPTPHARGAADHRRRPERRVRTNPACAGSSSLQRTDAMETEGPTPHARGAASAASAASVLPGTNPACAGSSGR
ncbi:hypothetical protein KPATCC21470_1986 [Kitasatospora purpeofusca]